MLKYNYSIDPIEIAADILALPVTFEPLPPIPEHRMSAADTSLMQSMYYAAREADRSVIPRLKKLIKKYPANPTLKNHLMAAYSYTGQPNLAEKIGDRMVADHPTYLFGILRRAVEPLEQGTDCSAMPELLGATLRLGDRVPEAEVFHFSEVRSYYCTVGHFHLKMGNLHAAEAVVRALEELGESAGLSGEPEVLQLAEVIVNEKLVQRVEKTKAATINVDFNAVPEPVFGVRSELTHGVLEVFYHIGFGIYTDAVNRFLELPRKSLIADLESVLRDAIERGGYFLAEAQSEESQSSWDGLPRDDCYFPMHAIFFLGELRSEGSVSLVLELLSQHPDILAMYFGDALGERLWQPLYHLLGGQLEVAHDFLIAPGVSRAGKCAVVEAAVQVITSEPQRSSEVIGMLGRVLELVNASPREDNILDTEFISHFIWIAADHCLEELMPPIRAAYERGHVIESIVGDEQEIVESISPPVDKKHLRKLNALPDLYREMMANYSVGEELGASTELANDQHIPMLKVGRNDPCPCGSGKKYKKCCL
jgi:hypothetical protein